MPHALAKYRINPGNVGKGPRGGANFSEICAIALDHGAAIRIGVNGGSLDADLVTAAMAENATHAAAAVAAGPQRLHGRLGTAVHRGCP